MIKKFAQIIIVIFSSTITLPAQTSRLSTSDSIVQSLYYGLEKMLNDKYSTTLQPVSNGDSFQKLQLIKSSQNRQKDYWEQGLEISKKFPESKIKFIWLASAIGLSNYDIFTKYLDNNSHDNNIKRIENSISFDWVRYYRWKHEYAKLKAEFLTEYQKNPNDLKSEYCNILIGELSQFLALSVNIEFRKNSKIDLDTLSFLFRNTSIILEKEEDRDMRSKYVSVLNLMDNNFLADYKQLGLNENDLFTFLNMLDLDQHIAIKKWVKQRRKLFSLISEPFELSHKGINGEEIDISKLRGKVILVDFWATWCSGCIKRMPAIKKMYDKYKAQGFEVISVSLNSNSDIEKVLKVKEKIGADWPTMIIGGNQSKDFPTSPGNKIWSLYGFSGVPQLLLLNKKGELVILNNELRSGNFEPILVSLLSQ